MRLNTIKKKILHLPFILLLGFTFINLVSARSHGNFEVSDSWYFSPAWGGNKPTYSNLGRNTTLASNHSKISCLWTDDWGIHTYALEHNNTGTLQNVTGSLTGASGWANVTLTLNDTIGVVIAYRSHCNDSVDQWNSTDWAYLTTTYEWIHTTGSSGLSWGNFMVLIRCFVDNQPKDNVRIEFFLLPYNQSIGGITTGFDGRADYNLPQGEYVWVATCGDLRAEGYLLHEGYEDIRIDLSELKEIGLSLNLKVLVLMLAFLGVAIGGVMAILKVRRMV